MASVEPRTVVKIERNIPRGRKTSSLRWRHISADFRPLVTESSVGRAPGQEELSDVLTLT